MNPLSWIWLYVLQKLLLDKNSKITPTSNDCCLIVMVYRELHHNYLFEVGLTQIPTYHKALSIVCHVDFHVDFSSMKFSLSLLGLHLLVWSKHEQSPPFQPIRALRLQWSRTFNLVCRAAFIFFTTTLNMLISVGNTNSRRKR